MVTVYKYMLRKSAGRQTLSLPKDAEVLHFGIQNEDLCIWIKVNTEKSVKDRHFVIYGTGWKMGEEDVKYVGTVGDNPYVWHLFEIVEGA